jgi:hypothetical protein
VLPLHFFLPTLTLDPGGIGQPLSLLLKLNPLITELSLYDVVNAAGVRSYFLCVNNSIDVIGRCGLVPHC